MGGAFKAVGGAVETVAGAALFTAGLGTAEVGVGVAAMAGGGIVVAHGIDTFQAGARQMFSRNQTSTLTATGLQAAGMSPTAANLTDTGVSVLLSGGASMASGAVRTSAGLVHLTSAGNAARITETGTLIGSNYAGPASNAVANGLEVSLKTGLNPGVYASVTISAQAQAAFTPVAAIGPMSTLQASMGQVYTGNGILNLATGAFSRAGANVGQNTIYALDAAFTAGRVGTSIIQMQPTVGSH